MWKLASNSIKEGFKSKGEDVVTKPRKPLLDSSRDRRKTKKEARLECPICWESFNVIENVPYVLWCGHTICKHCLIGLQRAIVIKSLALPFQLPFFVACPWCSILSLRLVCNGTIKFPSKNYYLLWMVDCRSESRIDNKRVASGESAVVLGVYVFVTFALAVPSFFVLYFAFPSLNWLIREISA